MNSSCRIAAGVLLTALLAAGCGPAEHAATQKAASTAPASPSASPTTTALPAKPAATKAARPAATKATKPKPQATKTKYIAPKVRTPKAAPTRKVVKPTPQRKVVKPRPKPTRYTPPRTQRRPISASGTCKIINDHVFDYYVTVRFSDGSTHRITMHSNGPWMGEVIYNGVSLPVDIGCVP